MSPCSNGVLAQLAPCLFVNSAMQCRSLYELVCTFGMNGSLDKGGHDIFKV